MGAYCPLAKATAFLVFCWCDLFNIFCIGCRCIARFSHISRLCLRGRLQLDAARRVRAFIARGRALPKIASEEEARERGGVNLGQLQIQLLYKIQELTLHTIDWRNGSTF